MEYYNDDQAAFTRRQTNLLIIALILLCRAMVELLANLQFIVFSNLIVHKTLPAGTDKMYALLIGIAVLVVMVGIFRMIIAWTCRLKQRGGAVWLLPWLICFTVGVAADVWMVQSFLVSWNVKHEVAWLTAVVVGFIAYRRQGL